MARYAELLPRMKRDACYSRTRLSDGFQTHIPADEVIVVVVDHPPGGHPHRVPLPEVVAPKLLLGLAHVLGDAWTVPLKEDFIINTIIACVRILCDINST